MISRRGPPLIPYENDSASYSTCGEGRRTQAPTHQRQQSHLIQENGLAGHRAASATCAIQGQLLAIVDTNGEGQPTNALTAMYYIGLRDQGI